MAIDSSAVHNWRRLVDHLKDYTYQDIMELSIVERRVGNSLSLSLSLSLSTLILPPFPLLSFFQGESASKSLLCDLNSRGWTVVDLAELAVKAGALEVVRILQDYCRGNNFNKTSSSTRYYMYSGWEFQFSIYSELTIVR